MKKLDYIAFDKFILRTPIFPYESISNMNEYLYSNLFKEAIFLASNELLNIQESYKGEAKKEKIIQSYLKYFLRACTRCTPFGLFAGCSIGKIGDISEIELVDIKKYERCTRLDMQFLCELIKKLETLAEIQEQILYYPNDSIYQIADKFRFIEYHNKLFQRQYQISSVEFTDYISMIIIAAKKGATIHELTNKLVDSEITFEEAKEFVYELINSQILKSELEPCVVGDDILEILIKKISTLENIPILNSLHKIKEYLNQINQTDIGDSIQIYNKIINTLNEFKVEYNPKYLFQTDLYKPTTTSYIAKDIVDEIKEALFVLGKFSVQERNPDMDSFIKIFTERYGEKEVPLQNVLDSELGIGYPVKYGHSISPLIDDLILPPKSESIKRIGFKPIDFILLNKYSECLINRNDTILLESNDLKKIKSECELPDTISVMCNILRKDNDVNLIYIKSFGGNSGANLLGRFCHINPSIHNFVKEIAEKEKELQSNFILVELSHLSESRVGNIMSRPKFRDCILHYLSNVDEKDDEMSVSDLMVSVKDNKVFLRSKKFNKFVIPKSTCAHNYSLSSLPVYRFLCDFQDPQNIMYDLNFRWNDFLKNVDYLPRVQYKNIILSRKRWVIRESDLIDFDKLEDKDLQKHIKYTIDKKKIASKVFIPDYDNELYIDFENINHIKLFLSIINKRKAVILEESLLNLDDNPLVKCDNSTFTNEFIFVFHK